MNQQFNVWERLNTLLTAQEYNSIDQDAKMWLRYAGNRIYSQQQIYQDILQIHHEGKYPTLFPFYEDLYLWNAYNCRGARFDMNQPLYLSYQQINILDENVENQYQFQLQNIDPLEPEQHQQYQEVEELKFRKIDAGNALWQGNAGDRYYSIQGADYEIPIDAIPPLFTNVFLPGTLAPSNGPRLLYAERLDFEDNEIQQPIYDDRFAIEQLERTNFDPLNPQSYELFKTKELRVYRIKLFSTEFQLESEIIDDIVMRCKKHLIHLFNQENFFEQYKPIRFFVNIHITGKTVENKAPLQMHFQTIKQIQNDEVTIQQIIFSFINYLHQQIELDLQTNYYYEEIEQLYLQYVVVFLLVKKRQVIPSYQHFEDIEDYIALGIEYEKSEKVWKKIDICQHIKPWKGLRCLEKILLFFLNIYRIRRERWTYSEACRKYPIVFKKAMNGQAYEVYKFIQTTFSEDLNLYIEEMNFWLREKPSEKDDCFVIILRKNHAMVVKNLELQKEMSCERKCFKLSDLKPQIIPIVKFVFDIETFSLNTEQIPYLICVISQFNMKRYFWGLDCVKQFVTWCNKQIQKYTKSNIEFWSFNGSKFDNLLIISEMLKQSSDVQILGSNTQIKIIKYREMMFYDMILMYPGSLQTVATQLQCETTQKTGLNVAGKSQQWYEENKIQVVEYCYNDCQILLEIVRKHYEYKQLWNLEYTQIGTNSALSLKIFQKNFMDKELLLEGASSFDQYHREKESYHGGVTINVYKGECRGKFYYYDINSSYPNVMQHEMPWKYEGSHDYQEGEELKNTNMYEIEGEWESQVLIPIYCEPKIGDNKIDSTLIYLKKFSRQCRWGIELKEMVENKLFKQLKIYKVFVYYPAIIFNAFVQELYKKRLEYREQKKNALCQAVKLTLNSLYGKMGQRQFPETIWCLKENVVKYLNKDNLASLDEVDEVNQIYRIQLEQKETLNFLGGLVRIASYITAAARMNLFRMFYVLKFENIVYTDTDSLISYVPMPEEYIHESKLGKWKLEHEVQHLTIWGPKFYRIKTSKDEKYEHIKGVRKENYCDNLWNQLMTDQKVEIVNRNVFTKKFGHVWVNDQKKVIAIKTPNRNFETVSCVQNQQWFKSKPYKDLNEFKSYHNLCCHENIHI